MRARDYVLIHLLLVPSLLAAGAWAVQYGSLDIEFSRAFFDETTRSFPGRYSAALEIIGHQAARALPAAVSVLAFALGLAGFIFRPLRPWRRVALVLGLAVALGPLAINFLKTVTRQHCPVDMQTFGGLVEYAWEQSASFWAETRESAGRCLPSGHAGGGFALLALYFAGWVLDRPAWRWTGLAIGVGAGFMFSVVRVAQGAHFASATMWSATIDWTVCALLFMPLVCKGPDSGR